jgi:Sigma-70 region 2
MRRENDADFTVFVTASSRRLLRTAFLITGDLHTAEDVLQTALERVYVRWGRIRRRELPEAYVRRVVVNAAIDGWRATRGGGPCNLTNRGFRRSPTLRWKACRLATRCWPASGNCPPTSGPSWSCATSTT